MTDGAPDEFSIVSRLGVEGDRVDGLGGHSASVGGDNGGHLTVVEGNGDGGGTLSGGWVGENCEKG